MNPILQNLNQNPVQMFNMVRNARNPQAMMSDLVNSNPQMRQVMDIVKSSGGDPRAAFYKMAQQKGVDPNSVLNMLRK